jgi:hypothetical protein
MEIPLQKILFFVYRKFYPFFIRLTEIPLQTAVSPFIVVSEIPLQKVLFFVFICGGYFVVDDGFLFHNSDLSSVIEITLYV